MRRVVGIFLLIFLAGSLSAGKLDKAFEALQVYNYFKAKALFEKSYKKDTAGAGYGLSIIFLRQISITKNACRSEWYVRT